MTKNLIVDLDKVGTKGYPLHWKELGIAPPMKESVEEGDSPREFLGIVQTEEEILEQWRKSTTLSRRRFKIGEALYQVNNTPLVELIEALLAGLPEPTKTVATIAYNESGSFDRLDPFILQFSHALGMSEEEVDEFFRYCIEEEWRNVQ